MSLSLTLLLALGAQSYSALAEEAQPVNNLGRYLEQYLGDCDSDEPGFDKKGCVAALRDVQRSRRGKLLRIVFEDVRDQISFAGWDKRKQAFRVHLTPLFPERAVAMSVGKPKRLNADGLPVMKNIPIWVPLPDGEPEFAFRRRLERGMVRLELLVKPKAPWRKQRRGEDPIVGLDVELVALRLLPARSDVPLSERIFKR